MKSTLLALLTLLPATLLAQTTPTDSLTWFDGQHAVTYHVAGRTDLVVGTAVAMFRGDMQAVTGLDAEVAGAKTATLQLLQLDRATRRERHRYARMGIDVDTLLAHPDAFQIVAREGRLWLAGGNGRGVAYALLELSREAGVSPWIWWGDVTPERRHSLRLPADYARLEIPSVAYRGIFINDEDWSTRPWSTRTFARSGTPGLISARTYKALFQLLLRLRGNLIWPAMHEGSVAFYRTPGARATADSCGILVGTSHCEPLMRNNVGEWDTEQRGRYNYLTNRAAVQAYWSERLRQTGRDENIYTLGMRGIHDGPMEGVKTLREQTDALQTVLDDQRALLQRYVGRDLTRVPQVFVPYKEVLQIMENGLRVPDDVTLVWCDDNYGYLTRLPDSLQQQRAGGHGLYYHLSYWGRPHDYLWLSCTQPGLIYEELTEAYRHNVRRLWVANVHDPKVAAFPLELFMDLAWDVRSVSAETLRARQTAWLSRTFGPTLGTALTPTMEEFYRLVAIRRPEFMGWCQNELDKKVYPRGLSPVRDTEFSFTDFGGTADQYLASWRTLRTRVRTLQDSVPARLRDAYFAHVLYPVCAAADLSVKLLEAQRARLLAARMEQDSLRPAPDAQLQAATADACRASLAAHREIASLTRYYNDSLAGGRWRGLMDAQPRRQLVFDAPTLPDFDDAPLPPSSETSSSEAPADSVASPVATAYTAQRLRQDSSPRDYIARRAADYDTLEGTARRIEQLGHTQSAVALSRGSVLTYTVDYEAPTPEAESDTATLTVALIPTHPLDRGDLRLSIQWDGDEPQVCSLREGFRTEPWKQNVLRAQALRTVRLPLAPGRHTLRLQALDDHLILDQWFLDLTGRGRTPYPLPLGE
jgi:hypothetical protein